MPELIRIQGLMRLHGLNWTNVSPSTTLTYAMSWFRNIAVHAHHRTSYSSCNGMYSSSYFTSGCISPRHRHVSLGYVPLGPESSTST